MAGSAGGTISGALGIISGPPDTLEIVTRSPLLMVRRAGSWASKYPQWRVWGPGWRCGIGMCCSVGCGVEAATQHVSAADPTGTNLQRRDGLHLDQERLLHQAVDDQQRIGRIGAARKQPRKLAL